MTTCYQVCIVMNNDDGDWYVRDCDGSIYDNVADAMTHAEGWSSWMRTDNIANGFPPDITEAAVVETKCNATTDDIRNTIDALPF